MFRDPANRTWAFAFVRGILRAHNQPRRAIGYLRLLICWLSYPEAVNAMSDRDCEFLYRLVTIGELPLGPKSFHDLCHRLPTLVTIGHNQFMVADFEDLSCATLAHEKKTARLVLDCFREGEVFVDVGANIGGYTLMLVKRGKVYAFEPELRNYTLLLANIRLNGLQDRVRVFNNAVGDRAGKISLFRSEFHGLHSVVRQSTSFQDVDAVTLDGILGTEQKIGILKIDVEGAEPLVLKGAAETLRKTRIIVVETGPTFLESQQFLRRYLSQSGFLMRARCDGNDIFVRPNDTSAIEANN